MVFELIDRTGVVIRLTKFGLKHILREHPDVSVEDIKMALLFPTKITTSTYDNTVLWYYRFNKYLNEYLMVAVKYLNQRAFIITAYYTRKIK